MLLDQGSILGFAMASFAVAVSPGPSWMYVLSCSLSQGKRAGMLAILGNAAGISLHVLAATLGISIILKSSEMAFTTLKIVGGAYLIYLGIKAWRNKSAFGLAAEATSRSMRSIFAEGVLVNALNPKVSLLMLALLPQFIDPARGSTVIQTAMLGSLHILIASSILTVLTLTSVKMGDLLRSSPRMRLVMTRCSGTVLILFGIKLLFARA
jgi:threonine/homoserine/homoserine lactone efflux protein